MMMTLLALLFVADLFLVYFCFRLRARQNESVEAIKALSEERSMLLELRHQIRGELQAAQQQARSLKDQVQVLATEAEQEVRQGISDITREVEVIIGNVASKLDGPMSALEEKQHFVAKIARDAARERENLTLVVSRAEQLVRVLKSSGSWEDVVDELESKRVNDVRALLARGESHDKICRDFGISPQQIRIISGTL
jgi:type I site-specific restriction endonuclease